MTMTPQAIVAEQARRMIGRISGAAAQIGVKSDVRITVTSLRWSGKTPPRNAHQGRATVGDAITWVNRQAEAAEQRGDWLTFEISPIFPTFVIDTDGTVTSL